MSTKIPTAKWAQRDEVAFVTFQVCDCKDVKVEFQAKAIKFTGTSQKQCYESSLELFDEIDPSKSTWVKEGRGVFCTVTKKTMCYWPRLLKDTKKQHWLSVDFGRWKDEDDSSDDEAPDAGGDGGQDFLKMMNQMGGGVGGMPSMDGIGSDEEFDSDDEDMPGLEETSAGDSSVDAVTA